MQRWREQRSCDSDCVGLQVILADCIGTATSRMRFECDDLHETLCFWVNRGSVAEKSWLTCATVAGGAALAWNHILDLRAQWNWGFQVAFSLLCWPCAMVVCMCWGTLCIGTGASKRCVLQYYVAILLCFAKLQVRIAMEWLRQGYQRVLVLQ